MAKLAAIRRASSRELLLTPISPSLVETVYDARRFGAAATLSAKSLPLPHLSSEIV
ncbi:MAG: hypothetical protein ABSD31_19625 [Candidatus Binataceae bacterium]